MRWPRRISATSVCQTDAMSSVGGLTQASQAERGSSRTRTGRRTGKATAGPGAGATCSNGSGCRRRRWERSSTQIEAPVIAARWPCFVIALTSRENPQIDRQIEEGRQHEPHAPGRGRTTFPSIPCEARRLVPQSGWNSTTRWFQKSPIQKNRLLDGIETSSTTA